MPAVATNRQARAGMTRIAAAIAAALAFLAPVARAAEVALQAPPAPVDAGIPFEIAIVIENARDTDLSAPPLPDAAGLERVGVPSRREMSFTINRSRTVTLTFSYGLVARAPGRYELPAFTVDVDGTAHPIPATLIEVRAVEGHGLVALEIIPAKPVVYLGEPVDLVLRVRIRAYVDRQFGTLASESMWSMIELDHSDFGPFRAAIDERTVDRFGRRGAMRGREVFLPIEGGATAPFYEYELATRHWPAEAGPIDLAAVTVMMQYPTRLERRRDFFETRLEIAEMKRAAAVAPAPDVTVKPLPEAGQPPSFAGAVGSFAFAVSAAPADVAVGDPVTLTIAVTDLTDRAKLELIAPPRLDRVAALTSDFRVHTDPAAGTIDGRTKTFTQTIRPMRDDVTQIPPLPFASFDPQREAYVTVTSAAIPLKVRPAEAIAAGDVIGAAPPAGGPAELTEVAGGILANETDVRALLAVAPPVSRDLALAIAVLPPVAFLGAALGRSGLRRARGDARARGALRNARRRIDAARRERGPAAAEAVGSAVAGYVADRRGAPAGALTRAEVVEHLQAARVSPALVAETAAVLADCEELRFAGAGDGSAGALAERAAACLGRLDRERMR
jgi:hypothetical protein